ncbi:hypothetical protein [Bacillus sp. Marseille-P3661]|uniref:hypothetical protein n=1 Tax=Bacillus sp. Marseille-P3661 TaxID=1936234 RepID=UPI000C83C1C0|nr:hypothetical protein [Bacillus sp. Marseille-P3661]
MPSNQMIKKAIRSSGYYQWEIAELLGISEGHFCKLLRKELPKDIKKQIDEILATKSKVNKKEVQ